MPPGIRSPEARRGGLLELTRPRPSKEDGREREGRSSAEFGLAGSDSHVPIQRATPPTTMRGRRRGCQSRKVVSSAPVVLQRTTSEKVRTDVPTRRRVRVENVLAPYLPKSAAARPAIPPVFVRNEGLVEKAHRWRLAMAAAPAA